MFVPSTVAMAASILILSTQLTLHVLLCYRKIFIVPTYISFLAFSELCSQQAFILIKLRNAMDYDENSITIVLLSLIFKWIIENIKKSIKNLDRL